MANLEKILLRILEFIVQSHMRIYSIKFNDTFYFKCSCNGVLAVIKHKRDEGTKMSSHKIVISLLKCMCTEKSP